MAVRQLMDIVALAAIILWPAIPLFWTPVHFATDFFRRLGLLTYLLPAFTWLPIAFLIYKNRTFFLGMRVDLPAVISLSGIIFFIFGFLLHIWTGILLGLCGLMGIPELKGEKGNELTAEGPFSVVRHPTYLAHTALLFGVFLITKVIAVGIMTVVDLIVINIIVIPLEEKELSKRFGEKYAAYKKNIPRFLPRLRTGIK